jgi:hypothetical protein
MFRGFGSRKLQTSANVPAAAAPTAINSSLLARGNNPAPLISKSGASASIASASIAPAPVNAAKQPNTAALLPKKTFKNRIFGTAAQQANTGFLAAAKAGNFAKLKTYTDDPTAKAFISQDTQNSSLIASASIPSSDCFKLLANAFPQSLDAQTAGKENVLHVVLIAFNKVSNLNASKKTNFVQGILQIISIINEKKPNFINIQNNLGSTPLDIVCESAAKESNDVLSHILSLPTKPSQETLNAALTKIFQTNVKAKNADGWNKLFPKGQVHYKKASALLAAGAKPPANAPGVYGPLMGYYTKINSTINATKANLTEKATAAKAAANAELAQAALEEKAAQNAANLAAAQAKAAQNALVARKKAKALAITKKTTTVSKANSSKAAAVAALGPKKKLFGLFGGRRTRKNRKY